MTEPNNTEPTPLPDPDPDDPDPTGDEPDDLEPDGDTGDADDALEGCTDEEFFEKLDEFPEFVDRDDTPIYDELIREGVVDARQ